eukprot:6016948-Amphidinium_carterae.1
MVPYKELAGYREEHQKPASYTESPKGTACDYCTRFSNNCGWYCKVSDECVSNLRIWTLPFPHSTPGHWSQRKKTYVVKHSCAMAVLSRLFSMGSDQVSWLHIGPFALVSKLHDIAKCGKLITKSIQYLRDLQASVRCLATPSFDMKSQCYQSRVLPSTTELSKQELRENKGQLTRSK